MLGPIKERVSRLLSQLRNKWRKDSVYPLSLDRAAVSALAEISALPQWAAVKTVCERYAILAVEELRVRGLAEQEVHYLRGVMDTALKLPDLVERIPLKAKEHDDRTRAATNGKHDKQYREWGSEYFRDAFGTGNDPV